MQEISGLIQQELAQLYRIEMFKV